MARAVEIMIAKRVREGCGHLKHFFRLRPFHIPRLRKAGHRSPIEVTKSEIESNEYCPLRQKKQILQSIE
jgi:hypothetical protein